MQNNSNSLILSGRGIEILQKQNMFLYKTYLWMFSGLFLTAATAFITARSEIMNFVINTPLSIIGLLLIQVGVVVGLTNFISKINTILAGAIFLFYSILTGLTVTPVVIKYTDTSIATTFIAASIMFAIMSAYGHFTKQDLGTFGSMALMGLIGIILGAVINILFNNSIINWIITYAGITVFLILTAYDMQKLKNISFVADLTHKDENNIAIVGALSLYLDFINLFVWVLRIFGSKR